MPDYLFRRDDADDFRFDALPSAFRAAAAIESLRQPFSYFIDIIPVSLARLAAAAVIFIAAEDISLTPIL